MAEEPDNLVLAILRASRAHVDLHRQIAGLTRPVEKLEATK